MIKLSDYELILAIKNENDRWAMGQLWTRYQPMVSKRTQYLHKIVYKEFHSNDIRQEFYLAFLNALSYIDLNRVSSEEMKFSSVYFWFLRKKERQIKKEFFYRMEHECDTEVLSEEPDEGVNGIVPEQDYTKGVEFQQRLMKFYHELPKDHQKIISLILKDTSIREIARLSNQKYHKVYYQVRSLRAKAKEELCRELI